MPRLSKVILLPAALSVAACLSVAPGVGQPGAQATSGETLKIESLDQTLAPGNHFDKHTVEALIPSTAKQGKWVRLPAWLTCNWVYDEISETVIDKNGLAKGDVTVERLPGAGVLNVNLKDKSGDLWHYEAAPHWKDDTLFSLAMSELATTDWCYSVSALPATDGRFTLQESKARFFYKKDTGEITKDSCREVCTGVYQLIDPTIMQLRVKVRKYNWQGALIAGHENVVNCRKCGEVDTTSCTKGADGQTLYPSFVKYLEDNGMADRIPDAPPVAPEAVAKP